LDDVVTSTPPQIVKLLRLCLEKDVRKRRRDIGDVRIDIEQALKEPQPAERAHRSRLAWVAAILMTLVTCAVVFVAIYLRSARAEEPEMRVDIVTPAASDPISFAISPDGRRLAFVASSEGQPHLWVRPLDGVRPQVLGGTEGATQPFWSPDKTRIATPAITYRQQYDIAPDGRFLINETTEDAYTSPITLLLNWKPPTR
jgi:eukaryotic-like serine/threonine-protein kinase